MIYTSRLKRVQLMHPSILFSLYVCGVGDIPTDNLSTRQFFKTTICQHDNLPTRHFIKRQFFKTTIFQTTISQFKTTIYQHDNFPTKRQFSNFKRQFSNETTIFQLQTTIFQFQMTIFTFSLAKVYKQISGKTLASQNRAKSSKLRPDFAYYNR